MNSHRNSLRSYNNADFVHLLIRCEAFQFLRRSIPHRRHLDTMNRKHCLLRCRSSSIYTKNVFNPSYHRNHGLNASRANTHKRKHTAIVCGMHVRKRHIASTQQRLDRMWIVGWCYAVYKMVHTCSQRFSLFPTLTLLSSLSNALFLAMPSEKVQRHTHMQRT